MSCSHTMHGQYGSRMNRQSLGLISCPSTLGCSHITLQGVEFICSVEEQVALEAPLQVSGSGAKLIIWHSNISGCSSAAAGGSMRVYVGASLTVTASNIINSSTYLSGGGVAVLGATAQILEPNFVNCISREAGGSIWMSSFGEIDFE